jgi:mRNA-degrading endonuclease toxin of MazEF toxin-antitoxin module
VITRDSALRGLNNVTIAPVTRAIRNVETEMRLEPADGVPTSCAIILDNIFTIQRSALEETIALLSREKMFLVFAAIRNAFDMPAENPTP